MTEDELVDDLGRLLRAGLVYVDQDHDTTARPRFALTAHGRDVSTDDRLFRKPPAAVKAHA